MGSFVVQTINTDPVKSHEKNNNKNRGIQWKGYRWPQRKGFELRKKTVALL